MATTAIVVIGANYGDEGKGLMTDYFAAQASDSIVVRFNGGPQAGHTVTTPEGARHVFSHFGSGSLTGAATYLSRHFAVNPALYLKEQLLLRDLGFTPSIQVDTRAPVTTYYDMLINQVVEGYRSNARHGSCGMGFGETIGRSELPDYLITVADLESPSSLREKLTRIRDDYLPRRCAELGLPNAFLMGDAKRAHLCTSDVLVDAFMESAMKFLEDATLVPSAALLRAAGGIVFEGAQGLLLDQNRGAFPHVTRSNTGIANVLDIAREADLSGLDVVYVTRAYLTRHGAGPLAHELAQEPCAGIEDRTNQPNPYQGALRFAYLDHDLLARAIRVDLSDCRRSKTMCSASLAVTCLDQLGTEVCFWKDGVLQQATKAEQLADLNDEVLSVGYVSDGPTRDDIRSGSSVGRALRPRDSRISSTA